MLDSSQVLLVPNHYVQQKMNADPQSWWELKKEKSMKIFLFYLRVDPGPFCRLRLCPAPQHCPQASKLMTMLLVVAEHCLRVRCLREEWRRGLHMVEELTAQTQNTVSRL